MRKVRLREVPQGHITTWCSRDLNSGFLSTNPCSFQKIYFWPVLSCCIWAPAQAYVCFPHQLCWKPGTDFGDGFSDSIPKMRKLKTINYLTKFTLQVSNQPKPKSSGLFHHNARPHTLARTDWALATWGGEGFGERKVLTMNVLVTSVKPTLLELIKWWAAFSGLALSEKMSCSVQG